MTYCFQSGTQERSILRVFADGATSIGQLLASSVKHYVFRKAISSIAGADRRMLHKMGFDSRYLDEVMVETESVSAAGGCTYLSRI